MQTAEDIVNALLEDIDADLPSHKSEVRILPTSDPRRFDVTLLTGFDPVYIGTLGHQGNVWKPVEVMPGIGREFRARLHFVGPNKEDVAMAMVQVLRPIWKRKIAAHLTDQMESEEVDPKAFVIGRRTKWAFDLQSHPASVHWSEWWKPGNWYRYRNGNNTFVLTFKGGDRPHRKWGVSVTRPGRGKSIEIAEIVADELADAADEASWIANKFYTRLGESADDEIEPKAFVQQKIGHDIDIKRVIEENYPAVEVLKVAADPGYHLRFVATIRSKDPASHPLWHGPMVKMINDLEQRLWRLYGWKMRPYANQEHYPESSKTNGVAGIKPISICYNNATGIPGTFDLLIDFDIMRRDDAGGYAEQSDWGTPYR